MSTYQTQPDFSSNSTLCDQLQALIPAYCFGIVDADERAFVEANLSACPEAAAEIASYRQLAVDLGREQASVAAPASLRTRIFSAIDSASVTPPALVARETTRRGAAQPDAAQPAQPQLHPRPDAPAHRQSAGRPRISLAFVAALLLALLVSNVLLFTRVDQLDRTQSSLQREIVVRDQALELLWTGDSERVWMESLAPAAAQPEPVAAVVWSPQRENAVLYVRRFPKPAENEAYQLWLTFYGERTSPGTFEVDEEGNGLMVFEPPHPLHSCERMGITREPLGGSDAPTTPAITALDWTDEGD